MENPEHLVEARGVWKRYRTGKFQVEALRGVDLDVAPGEFALILGPSGGGKSTLLHILGGIDHADSGQVRVDGKSLEKANEKELTRFRRDHIGFVFQFYNLLSSLNALDNVLLPLLAKGWSIKKARPSAETALHQVGLMERWRHRPGELSGGEQQRVAIARALVASPAVILADEPTGDLDSNKAREIFELMQSLNHQLGTTFIVASHNPSARSYATSCYELHDGILNRDEAPG